MSDQADSPHRLAKALSHPVRIQILRILAERGEASPNGMHTEIGENLANVSYHTNTLKKLGLIELSRTEPRRGAVEHFYVATPGDGFYSLAAFASGQIRDGAVFRWLPLYVDERGAERIAKAIQRAEEQVLRAAEESGNRLEDGAAGINLQVALSFFQTDAPPEPPARIA